MGCRKGLAGVPSIPWRSEAQRREPRGSVLNKVRNVPWHHCLVLTFSEMKVCVDAAEQGDSASPAWFFSSL